MLSIAKGRSNRVGKRSDFERIPRDFYETPPSAVQPLLRFLPSEVAYIEPCAGNGALIGRLAEAGHICTYACDIDPQGPRSKFIHIGDARQVKASSSVLAVTPEYFITNPPWEREMLHAIIGNLCAQLPTWLLMDADWMHTKQSIPMLPWIKKIVSIGRVKWIADSPHTGKDNCCWYLFDQNNTKITQFFGRT
jgi:hypothetical protein